MLGQKCEVVRIHVSRAAFTDESVRMTSLLLCGRPPTARAFHGFRGGMLQALAFGTNRIHLIRKVSGVPQAEWCALVKI